MLFRSGCISPMPCGPIALSSVCVKSPSYKDSLIACGAHQDNQCNRPTSRPLMTPTKFSCLLFSLYKVALTSSRCRKWKSSGGYGSACHAHKGIETHPRLGRPSLSSVVGVWGRLHMSLNTMNSWNLSQRSLAHGGALMPTFGDYITMNR